MRPHFKTAVLPLIVLLVLAAWIYWLRWPTFGWKVWNMDEGIYATIGRVILEGGVMYRDGIDNRTPLTHYLSAAVYGIVGINNQWGAHFVLAGTIASIAFAVFLIGRRWYGSAGGLAAALAFATLSSTLLHHADANSLGCEWYIIFFSSWSAWWFLRSLRQPGFWRPFVAGLGYAAAFLAKQPGLLEIGAPLAVVVYLYLSSQWRLLEAARVFAALVAGFTALVALVFGYFWLKGALGDFYLYAWVFNMVYYTTETSVADRVIAASMAYAEMWRIFPVLFLALVACVVAQLRLLAQRRPDDGERAASVPALFVVTWIVASTAGAAAAGRVYGHYYIQTFPALALAIGWTAAVAVRAARTHPRWLARGVALSAAIAIGWSVSVQTAKRRHAGGGHEDGGLLVGAYIRENSRAEDRIFVWGFNPDLYLFADRAPASRFIYCGFQTGLIPWTNAEPHIDTGYAVIPGSMEALLADLERERPEFFVDGSDGAGRMFGKYPLSKFPRLASFVAQHYVEVEPGRFRIQQFRVLRLKDASRRSPPGLAGGSGGELLQPTVTSPALMDAAKATFIVEAGHTAGRLQRVEFLVDGAVTDALSFPPAKSFRGAFVVDAAKLSKGPHEFSARVTSSSAESVTSAVVVAENAPESLNEAARAAFPLPIATTGIAPVRVTGPFGAAAQQVGAERRFAAHAPATFTYRVAPRGSRVTGKFGIDEGAYAPTKPDPTDGAEFIVSWVPDLGAPLELFRRFLEPRYTVADRGVQSFSIQLPPGENEGALEFRIANGPAGIATSDWTYWADLLLTR